MSKITAKSKQNILKKETLEKAFEFMCRAKTLAEKYEENKEVTSKYVHATSRGHEAIQVALGMQLEPQDYCGASHRDHFMKFMPGHGSSFVLRVRRPHVGVGGQRSPALYVYQRGRLHCGPCTLSERRRGMQLPNGVRCCRRLRPRLSLQSEATARSRVDSGGTRASERERRGALRRRGARTPKSKNRKTAW